MRLIIKLLSIAFLLISTVGCRTTDDSFYFSGEIKQIQDKAESETYVELTPVPLDGSNHGVFAVYDSLIFFMNPKLPDNFFHVFNVDIGDEIGSFYNKGQGPKEYTVLSPITHFHKEGDEVKAVLFAPHQNKLIDWNITNTFTNSNTLVDSIIPYIWQEQNNEAIYQSIYRLRKDTLLLYVEHGNYSPGERYLPFYQTRTLSSNKKIKDYPIYNEAIQNPEEYSNPAYLFNNNDALKPDGTKIVQVMTYIPQLNFLDLATGEVAGFRMKGSHSFSAFENQDKTIKTYYGAAEADDDYIYATYIGGKTWGAKEVPIVNTIHVFDWSGNLVRKIVTDKSAHMIRLDRARNRLYTMDISTDGVFYIELDNLLLHPVTLK